jgi:hypothetical protein
MSFTNFFGEENVENKKILQIKKEYLISFTNVFTNNIIFFVQQLIYYGT